MIDIQSPYLNVIRDFNNSEAYSDLALAVPGIRKPILLHKRILATTSEKFRKELVLCSEKFLWPFDTSNEIDRKVLVKALRFCYGESMTVGTEDGECCAMIAVLSRLQVTCLDPIVDQLKTFTIDEARKDVMQGVKLLKKCVEYPECCVVNGIELNKALANVVLTKQNMVEHFQEVVVECLMVLPSEYLDTVEYGEPHTQCSEFCLRTMYARYHSKEMSDEEKQAIVKKCDWSKLSSHELKELRLSDFVDKDELLLAYETVLACSENERDKEREVAASDEKEKEKEEKKTVVEGKEREKDKGVADYFIKFIPLFCDLLQEYHEDTEKRIESIRDKNSLLYFNYRSFMTSPFHCCF